MTKPAFLLFTLLLIPSLCSAKKHEVLLSCDNVEAIELLKYRSAQLYDSFGGPTEFISPYYLVVFYLPFGTISEEAHQSAERNRMGEQGVWKEVRLLTSSGPALSSDMPMLDAIDPQNIVIGYKSEARARKAAELVCKEKAPDTVTMTYGN
jgi:hypothetical protein